LSFYKASFDYLPIRIEVFPAQQEDEEEKEKGEHSHESAVV